MWVKIVILRNFSMQVCKFRHFPRLTRISIPCAAEHVHTCMEDASPYLYLYIASDRSMFSVISSNYLLMLLIYLIILDLIQSHRTISYDAMRLDEPYLILVVFFF